MDELPTLPTPNLRRRLASVAATFKPVSGRHANAVLLPLGRRAHVVRFAWRHGVRNPGSVWDRHLRDERQHVAVYSR